MRSSFRPIATGGRYLAAARAAFNLALSPARQSSSPWPRQPHVPIAISPLLTNGSTGVNLFFVLSGFVLSLPFAAGDRPLGTTRDWLSFYRRRALRLMPLFYV